MYCVLYVDVDEQTSDTILCYPMLWSVSHSYLCLSDVNSMVYAKWRENDVGQRHGST